MAETMEKTRITDVRGKLIGHLSKGYRQRVGLAQALLGNPDVLILDEPTAGLDPKQIIETRELIRGLGGEHTIILSTHILPEVSAVCGRVMIINKGRVVAEDTPENLTHRLRGAASLRVEARGDEEGVLGALRAVKGVVAVRPARGARACAAFEVDPEPGTDVRPEVARAVVSPRVRPARAAAGRHEPGGHLPAPDHDGAGRGGAGAAAGPDGGDGGGDGIQ